ncbi:MAG: hypothetical protein LBK12_09420 [Odoribacteraceae bacterium]|jgi:hypothetical protein|nr:hypothetical protein [Odoribacteraceae bacterium]
MKTTIIIIMALCLPAFAFSQDTVARKSYVYCEIVGTAKMLSNKVTIQVDFGQKTSFWKSGADRLLKGEDGKPIEFNSMVDAMNHFGGMGWEFVQAYVVTIPGIGGSQTNVYHWLLKREIEKEEVKSNGNESTPKDDANKANEEAGSETGSANETTDSR